MKLNEARLLTDENIHPEVVRFLEEQGHAVLDVKRDGLVGSSDLELVRRALAEERVIVTHDRDFGRLVFASGEPIWGVLYLRPGHHDPAFTLATLRAVRVQDLAPEVPFTVVAERQGSRVKIRLRHMEQGG